MGKRKKTHAQSHRQTKRAKTHPDLIPTGRTADLHAKNRIHTAIASDDTNWWYMKVRMCVSPKTAKANRLNRRFEKGGNLTEAFFKNALHQALQQRFGLLYAHPHLDLVTYDEERMQGVVRCERWMKDKVNAAFTLMTLLPDDKTSCRADVLSSSPFLFSL